MGKRSFRLPRAEVVEVGVHSTHGIACLAGLVPNDLRAVDDSTTTTSMIAVRITNRAQRPQMPLIVRLNMLRIDRGQPESVAASHCCDSFDVTAETAHLLIWATLTLPVVAMQFVVLLRENRVAD